MENVLHIYLNTPAQTDERPLPLMSKLKVYRPIFAACAFVSMFAASLAVFGTPAQASIILADAPTAYEGFTSLLGLIVQGVIALTFVVTLIWFVWTGKSKEQLKEQVAGWKDRAERKTLENKELEDENAKLKEARKNDRKKYLRLRAKLTGEDESEDLHDSDA